MVKVLVPLLIIIGLVLYTARRFDRLYAIEERRRAGLPTTDLIKLTPWTFGSTWAFLTLPASMGIWACILLILGIDIQEEFFGWIWIWLLLQPVGVWAWKNLPHD